MQVSREFEDEEVVRLLETMPEGVIRVRLTRERMTREEALAALRDSNEAIRRTGITLTDEEIQAEIDAHRREEQAA